MKKIYYFILAAVTMTLAACGDNAPTIDDNGALKGKFTVDDKGTQVQFSRGNLQYQASTNTWRFAENQWDFVGDAEKGTVIEAGEKSNNAKIDKNYTGWIDLFGWGTGNAPTESATDNSKYSNFVNWGTNAISNGGKTSNMWRTLKTDEWEYLFYGRTDAAKLFSMGKVNGVNGTILLPDNWSGDKYDNTTRGLTDQGTYYYNSNGTNFSFHTYEGDAWKAMEKAGAVFLPAAGDRNGTGVGIVGSGGYYWSATPYYTDYAFYLYLDSYYLSPQYGSDRYYGFSVRLVR